MMRGLRGLGLLGALGPLRALRPLRALGLLGLLGILEGCSSGEEQGPEEAVVETAISFAGGLQEGKAVTRAQGLETEATSFTVWGYKNDAFVDDSYTSYQTVFPGFIVNYGASTAYSTTTNTNGWEYVGAAAGQTIKYWDWGAKAYRFFAVAVPKGSSGAAGISEATGADGATVTFTASGASVDETPYYSELWFSNGNAVSYPTRQFGKPVQLSFKKPFALVKVEIHNNLGEMMDKENLEKFTFKPADSSKKIASGGTATITYPLKGTAAAATATCSFTGCSYLGDDGITGTFVNETAQYVLPASGQGSYEMTIKLLGLSDLRTCEVPAAYMNWKLGYEYTYIFKIDYNSVTLEIVLVGIKDWGVNEITHDVYNW